MKSYIALDEAPWLRDLNASLTRNERFYDALAVEKDPLRSFTASTECLDHAEVFIPLGAQTYSKSKLQFPEGAAPAVR